MASSSIYFLRRVYTAVSTEMCTTLDEILKFPKVGFVILFANVTGFKQIP